MFQFVYASSLLLSVAQPKEGSGWHAPEIGFTRKFLAAPLSYIHKIVHGLAAKYP